MDELAARELQATIASIGTYDGVKYHLDPDCIECIKDLIRFLRRDDDNHEVRRAIGNLGVVKSDLVYIIRDHANNRELFDVTLRLLVNLTNPELLLFKEELPEDKETRNYYLQIQHQRQNYKQAFLNKELWTVIAKYLGNLLKKDWDERLEDDKLVLERILILVRNILQVPADVRGEARTEGDATLHDQILWVLHQSGMEDLLLYIGSAEGETHYCIHVLEIITLMLREQDPTGLASSSLARSEEEKQRDESELRRAQLLEEEQRKLKARQIQSTRHSRFGGTIVLKNIKGVSEHDMIVHKPVHDLQSLNFDKSKRGLKRAKNRVAPEDLDKVRRSTLSVRIVLREFCVEFLLSAYNQLMSVVKDALNRQRAQLNDESYYLWAMRFFMEFNRAHEFKIELVSETLSRHSFHFLQQQIENYRDNFEFEKRNRPKYLMWAKRMHLAVRAYEELLLNLVSMEASKDDRVREAGRVIRAGVFYEPEYRELCLQQLSSFNPDRMTIGYLTDLVGTTHVFLKLMEHMAKNKHLLVSKKSKKRPTKSGKKGKIVPPGGGARQGKEEQWDAVSPLLSALLQGKGTLPTDLVPFDAASDVPIEDQKEEAMKRIQRALVNLKPDQAIALLRASREVWPEGEAFGSVDSEAEDDFMALREILFADLGATTQTTGEENAEDGHEEEEEGDEEEEEEEQRVYSVEQEFDYKAFVARFAVKNVVRPFGILFNNYEKNSKTTNHYIIKMFHRIAVDCGLPAILFQASIFRVFQRIWRDLKARSEDSSLRELAKFAKFILRQFIKTAESNKKVFMELLFWKTSKDALEIMEGYGTISSSDRQKKAFWTEEEEQKLTDIYRQVREMESQDPGMDVLDVIESMYRHENKTRRQIGSKLRDLGLINSIKEITKKPLGAQRVWSPEEIDKLTQLYQEYKDAEHPANRIHEQWKMAGLTSRSKSKLIEKIMELGLCRERARLGRVKKRRANGPRDKGNQGNKSETDSALEDSSSGSEESESEEEQEENQPNLNKDLVGRCKDWLESGDGAGAVTWLAGVLEVEGEDREAEGEGEDVSLVPLDEEQGEALLQEKFQLLLETVGLSKPCDGEQYWRIPADISAPALKARGTVLRRVVEGAEDPLQDIPAPLLSVSRGLQNLLEQTRRKKKKKRGASKWQPFRRETALAPVEDTAAAGPTSSTPKPAKSKTPRAKKSAKKSFLKSDSEDDIADPTDKSPPRPTVGGGKVTIDREKLLKLLNDEESELSSDEEEEGEGGDAANKDSEKSKKTKQRSLLADSSSDEGIDDPNPVRAETKASSGTNIKDSSSENEELDNIERKEKTTKSKSKKKIMEGKKKEKGKGSKEPAKKKMPSKTKGVDDAEDNEKNGKKSTKNKPYKIAESSDDDDDDQIKRKSSAKKKSYTIADSSDDDQIVSAKMAESLDDDEETTTSKHKSSKVLDSSEDDESMPSQKKSTKLLDSSDDESTGSKKTGSDVSEKKVRSILSSDEDTADTGMDTKRKVDSEAEQETVTKKGGTFNPTLSQSFDSRIDDSRLDDSRISVSSRRSRLDDSRVSVDSRQRSPRSSLSPLSSRSVSGSRSRSRSPSYRSPSSSPVRRSPSPGSSIPASPAASRQTPVSSSNTPSRMGRTPLALKNTLIGLAAANTTSPQSKGKRKRGGTQAVEKGGKGGVAEAESSGAENSPIKPVSKKRMAVQSDSE